ncbi:MAG: dienelactone hydrolase family protein [Aestuariivirga sp.]
MEQKYIDLFDQFTHGNMGRRGFLERLTALAGSAAAATALLPLLENNYAVAETVAADDPRLTASDTEIGTGLKGHLAMPKQPAGKLPAVIVIHENRGLNPHIKDVTRRLALEGFAAFGPDYLAPIGGTPEDSDKAREMIGTLKPEDVVAHSKAIVAALQKHEAANGKVGAIGFCWGGGQVNALAANDPALGAGVAYYGRQVDAAQVPNIKAALMLHYAEADERINAGIAAYEEALKANGKAYEIHMYKGAQHAFNNDSNAARYNKEAADLAWGRTVEFLKKNLAAAA